eukprot:Blabericola_migrator_1__2171@NODE_159_length_12571_cov_158_810301_g139_i0_p3_GENE_NODE_159_length_12571_cov_158_810301_g139_i0NODE_159_length_12571_cov_158_810301_g139_i0_p3_ORF_typecomplete_len836_score127_74_NODE_159_length_12571_cov_158_810301_g139_i04892996
MIRELAASEKHATSTTTPPTTVNLVTGDTDVVLGRILAMLEDKSPIHGFRTHLLQDVDSPQVGQSTPLGTVISFSGWPSTGLTPTTAATIHTHLEETAGDAPILVSVDGNIIHKATSVTEAHSEAHLETAHVESTHFETRHFETTHTESHTEVSHEAHVAARTDTHLEAHVDATVKSSQMVEREISNSSSAHAAAVVAAQMSGGSDEGDHRLTTSEDSNSQAAAIFSQEGKWEVLGEEELLADKETEHSKSASSYSSSHGSQTEPLATEAEPVGENSPLMRSTSDSSVYALAATSAMIAEGRRKMFPTVYISFILAVPPPRLQSLLQLVGTDTSFIALSDTIDLSQQLYCNPHLLQGLINYLRANPAFRDWCVKLVSTPTYTQQQIPSEHSPVAESVLLQRAATPMISADIPTSTQPYLQAAPLPPSTGYPTMASVSSMSIRPTTAPPMQIRMPSTPPLSSISGIRAAPTLSGVSASLAEDVTPRIGHSRETFSGEHTGTSPDMVPAPPSPEPSQQLAPLVTGGPSTALSPSCRVVDVVPGSVVTHTMAAPGSPQTTILRTPNVVVATTVELSDKQGRLAATSQTATSQVRPIISQDPSFITDQTGSPSHRLHSDAQPPLLKVMSPIEATPRLQQAASPINVTSVTNQDAELAKLCDGMMAPQEALYQLSLMSDNVLEESLGVLASELQHQIQHVEAETMRRLQALYATGCLERRTLRKRSAAPGGMSPRNIVAAVIAEIAFVETLRREVSVPQQSHLARAVNDMIIYYLRSDTTTYPARLQSFVMERLLSQPSLGSMTPSSLIQQPSLMSYARPQYSHTDAVPRSALSMYGTTM